jgi:hypothetical protein
MLMRLTWGTDDLAVNIAHFYRKSLVEEKALL